MKKAKDNTPVPAIPKACYEAGILNRKLRESQSSPEDKSTDLQGNGYPAPPHERKD